jgi:hypothetical protein
MVSAIARQIRERPERKPSPGGFSSAITIRLLNKAPGLDHHPGFLPELSRQFSAFPRHSILFFHPAGQWLLVEPHPHEDEHRRCPPSQQITQTSAAHIEDERPRGRPAQPLTSSRRGGGAYQLAPAPQAWRTAWIRSLRRSATAGVGRPCEYAVWVCRAGKRRSPYTPPRAEQVPPGASPRTRRNPRAASAGSPRCGQSLRRMC